MNKPYEELETDMSKTVEELADMPDGDLIRAWQHLHGIVDAMEAEHKKNISGIKSDMTKLLGALAIRLDRDKRDGSKTKWGTAYFSILDTVRVVDRDMMLNWVIENRAVDVLTGAVSKDAVRERGGVPGVEIVPIRNLHIRKPT
jgi:hypothetical protein